jgi:hypothetical protein
MTRPSPPELMAETARLAYHLHWPLDTILDLEHRDRRDFLAEADALAGLVPVEEDEAELADLGFASRPHPDLGLAARLFDES